MDPLPPKAHRGPYSDKPFRDALRIAVKRELDDTAQGKTKLDKIAAVLVTTASDGDVSAAKEIADRLDGKVPQAHVGGDEGDNPIHVVTEIRRSVIDPKSP